ncbi:Aste57867_10536 [Aphanomyces stellatus]|uniref:Protein C10 n=1 Tax=Aphanomyces stellatus TaxID=120398 RepID=A0A485KQQ2_9STRA|nr:hypothetical protein As57867_010496 [Aphanomyces stellatus]VFT87409.1 Aste57867_10536 [Aphanomyces stellatus]
MQAEEPTPQKDLAWADAILATKAKEQTFNCLVCGSKNVTLDVKTQRVYCRMCSTFTRNVFERPMPVDKLREMERLPQETAVEMLADILASFQHVHFKHRLDDAVRKAQGCFVELVLGHTPVALEAVRCVVTRFGFTDNLEGVMKAIRAIQEHAKDDAVVLDGLEHLRILFSPQNQFQAGPWPHRRMSMVDMAVEDALQLQDEARVVEAARQVQLQRDADVKKLEEMAQARRMQALVRAKKVARGLDPNQLYIPTIRRHPPASVVLLAGRSAFVSVVADHSDTYAWCWNGMPLADDSPGFRGVHTALLTIQFFTKSMCGAYTCRCANDDGSIESTVCLVSTVTLQPKMLQRMPTPHVVHSLALQDHVICLRTLHGITFTTPLSVASPLRVAAAESTAAIDAERVEAVAATRRTTFFSGLANGVVRVESVHIMTPMEKDAASAASAAAVGKRKASLPRAAAASTKPTAYVTGGHTRRVTTSLAHVKCVALLGDDTWLLVSDLDHTILLYAIGQDGVVDALPALSMVTPKHKRIDLVTASPSLPQFAVAFHGLQMLDVVLVTSQHALRHVELPLPRRVSCMAFASMGSQVAVGEKGVQHGHLRLVNAETKASNWTAPAHFGAVQFIRWIPRHVFFFTLGTDRVVKLWDAMKHTCVLHFFVALRGAPSDIAVACDAATMDCTLLVATYAKQMERWTIDSLVSLLESVRVEHAYAIVLIQKQWRGALARWRLWRK